MARTTPERELVLEILSILGVIFLAVLLRDCRNSEGADHIPPIADRYHRQLIREVRYYCGFRCDPALFAGQIHQESGWRSGICSAYACGLGQFTPATAKDMAQMHPSDLPGGFDVMDPWESLRAMVMYDTALHAAFLDFAEDAWVAALVAYNGGAGILKRESAAVKSPGPNRWWCQVEHVCLRTRTGACEESRDYPRKILFRWRPLYQNAGW